MKRTIYNTLPAHGYPGHACNKQCITVVKRKKSRSPQRPEFTDRQLEVIHALVTDILSVSEDAGLRRSCQQVRTKIEKYQEAHGN
jgi:hypothetical protein